MRQLQSKIKMRQELLRYLEKLERLHFQKTFEKNSFTTPQTRLGVIIATSILKVHTQTEELLASILEKKFFTSLSIMRTIFEEIILITFVLSKLEKTKSLEDANNILLRVSIGTGSYQGENNDIPKPYNIHTTLKEAEMYIASKAIELNGIFEDTYSFISDYVHPNAPSRFYFMREYRNKKRILVPTTTDHDMKMLLNYSCMAMGLFMMSIEKLLKFDLNTLRQKSSNFIP